MALFFTVFAFAQVLAGYVCAKGIYCITKMNWLGAIVMLLSVSVPFSVFVLHRSLKCAWLINLICYTGYIYLGFLLYFSIFCILAFIAYKLNSDINLQKTLLIGLIIIVLTLVAGYINAINPRLKKITIPADSNLRICFVSDIHIGSINTEKIFDNVLKHIEEANPDIVILGGDTIDIKGITDYSDNFIKNAKKITSKCKIYAVIGNHELYTGAQDCVNLLKKSGISLLLDDFANIGDYTLVGRLDKNILSRKKLQEIIPANKKHLIVVDHSPDSIYESAQNGAFLHLSGHTHGGQMFPINFITDFLYEPTGKLGKIGDTYFYITYGAGFWGPPYRVGNSPEVVLIDLKKREE